MKRERVALAARVGTVESDGALSAEVGRRLDLSGLTETGVSASQPSTTQVGSVPLATHEPSQPGVDGEQSLLNLDVPSIGAVRVGVEQLPGSRGARLVPLGLNELWSP